MLEELALVPPRPQVNRGTLAAEFPSIFIRLDDDGSPHVRASEWERADFDAWAFDMAIDNLAREPFTLRIADDDGGKVAFPLEVLNRCQRHIDRRNRHSQGQLFTRVLRKHRALHDLDKPLVRADYNHALDIWQWLLRLDPDASLPVQFAALFHDIERLLTESEARIEQNAANYQEFKDAHAKKGAEITGEVLATAGVSEAICVRVAELITAHERQSSDPEVALLNDADALSFFSLNSHGYASYFGPDQTRKKVAYTWNRMREPARARLGSVRLRGDVRGMVEELRRV
ncbi:MAG: DUF4202 domain-containing protein [Acidobacteriota bacterium]|nr:DUF4202 domain-containing protein [Acidobacteriota bacterium]